MFKLRKIIICVLIMFFCAIAVYVNSNEQLVLDGKIYSIISKLHSDFMTNFFKTITLLGNALIVAIICIVALLLDKDKIKIGLPISIVVIFEAVLNVTFKNIFSRERPSLEQLVFEDSFSFPSGHSMVTATLFSIFIYFAYRYIKSKKIKISIIAISVILIFLVGISRIYLRVHYFTDVIAGWTLGLIVTLIVTCLIERIENKMQKKIEEGV